MNLLIFSYSIPLDCTIGGGTRFGHRGIGCVINPKAVIGKNCLIRVHVVIRGGGRITGAPIIKDNVKFGAGAKIIGGVTIGENAIIGANAVVTSDIPANSLAVGVPAKVVRHYEP